MHHPPPGMMRGLAALLTAAGLVACTAGSNTAAAPEASSSRPSSAAATTATTAPSTPPQALPENCGALVPVTDLDAALGVGLPGSVSYVRGEPLPDIGRTGRITCGYGVAIGPQGKAAPPLLEISVSTYTDEAAAAARIDLTSADRQAAGDRVEATEVQTLPAVVLIGVTQTTLVLADSTRTYSLTLLAAVLPANQTSAGLSSVAGAVLDRAAAPSG